MGSGGSAPAQPTTTTDMSMFGASKTGAFGNEWKPTAFQKSFVGNAENMMSNAQNALMNGDIPEQRVNNLYNKCNNEFNTKYLAPALQKGLLRGATASDVYAMGQKDVADQYQDLLDAEEQRNNQRLANALANYTTIYDIAQGTTGLYQVANYAASQYALAQAQINNKNSNDGLYKMIGQGVGALGSLGSAALLAFSDKRLKENIKRLGTVNGINIYEFKYKKGLGLPEGKQIGVIAQEVIDLPNVVGKTDNGILFVDYSKLPPEVQVAIEELKNGLNG